MNQELIKFYNEKNSIWPHILTVEHFERMYEIVIVREGMVTYSIQGDTFNINSGQMLFINTEVLHHRVAPVLEKDQHEDVKFDILLISPDTIFPGNLINYYESISGENAIPFLLFSKGSQRHRDIIDMFEKAIAIYKAKEDGYELDGLGEIYSASNKLINYIRKVPGRLDEVYMQPELIKKMIGFIATHYKEKLSLAQIGKAAGICRSRCCSLFKIYMNESANDYLQYYRLAKSIELAEANDMSFVEISSQCGFNGASYYSELFKKLVHCTPTEYKEKIDAV